MTHLKDVANNFIVQILGKVLSIVFGLLTVGILTRHLGKTGFGEYTTAITYLSLFGVFVDFGLTLTLVQMICRPGADEEKLVGNLVGLRLVSGVIFYALAPATVLLFSYPHNVDLGVAVGAIGYLFMSTAGMLSGVFQKHLVMWRFAAAELVNRALMLLFVGLLAWNGVGVVGMFAALTVANAIWFLAVIAFARPLTRIRPRADLGVWKEALSRSWPMALSIIFNLIYLRGDVLLLAHFRPQAEVGEYGVAYKVIDVLTALPVMFMGLLLPKLTLAWSQGAKAEFRRYLQNAFDFFLLLSIPIAVGAQAVGESLTALIAGPGYEEAGGVLRILIVAVIFVFVSGLYGHAVVALEKQRAIIWAYAATAVLSLFGYFYFIPLYGMWGAAGVTLFSEALIATITMLFVSRSAEGLPHLGVASKAIAASAVMYAVLRVLPSIHVVFEVAVGACVYAAVLVGTGGVKLSSVRELLPKPSAKC